MAIPLLQFFFVNRWFQLFVLSLFVPHPSFYWSLGNAVLHDCDTSWVPSLIFLLLTVPNRFSRGFVHSVFVGVLFCDVVSCYFNLFDASGGLCSVTVAFNGIPIFI